MFDPGSLSFGKRDETAAGVSKKYLQVAHAAVLYKSKRPEVSRDVFFTLDLYKDENS